MAKIKKLGEKEAIITTASQIETLFRFTNSMDIDLLKGAKANLADSISSYEAIGILDGSNYFTKLEKYRAKLSRLDILIKFIEILRETNKVLTKESSGELDISKILGL